MISWHSNVKGDFFIMINHVTDSKSKVSFSAKQLAFCAMSMALAFVLSNVKFFKLPMGGSITLLSMLVACLPGYWYGPVAGIISGVAYGLLGLVIDPYILFPAQVIVDYILAFAALGLSGFFSNAKHGLIKGYIAAVLGRYFFAVLSGWLFFGEYAADYNMTPLPYSLAYNGIYIFAEAAITIVVLLLPPVRQLMNKLKEMATE
jgi:thiamine transporter